MIGTKQKKKPNRQIWLFGYLGHPNDQIFGYLLFGSSEENQIWQ
jgi:hypothetical protein